MKRFKPLDLDRVQTYPLRRRSSKVAADSLGTVPTPGSSLANFIAGLPKILAAADLQTLAETIADRHRKGRVVALGMGAHPIKVGLSPLIIDLMEQGILSAIAMNGACIVHDFELAYHGATSEDVGASLDSGRFGMARETGRFLNQAINASSSVGLGRAVGNAIRNAGPAHEELSILAAAARLDIPATVHVAVGTDIIHMHPEADGAAIGAASMADFRTLAGVAQKMNRGVFINLGSAVIIPEVFLKALNLARNVGNRVDKLVTLDMDFMRHYRPGVNVVQRPTQTGGKGYRLTGHHEIMFPLLCAALLEEIASAPPAKTQRKKRRVK